MTEGGQKKFIIRNATDDDVQIIFDLIKELASFENLSHGVTATVEKLRKTLFGVEPAAEVIIGELDSKPIAFALYFQNYSTFLGQPGIYVEDIFVRPECRGKGYGPQILAHLAKLALDRGCGRLEWTVLDWDKKSIEFYERLGARPMSLCTTYRMTVPEMKKLTQDGPPPY